MSESLKRTKSLRKCWCDVVLLSPNIQHNVRRTLGHRKVREDPKKQTSTTTTKKLKRKVGDENRGNPVFFFFTLLLLLFNTEQNVGLCLPTAVSNNQCCPSYCCMSQTKNTQTHTK